MKPKADTYGPKKPYVIYNDGHGKPLDTYGRIYTTPLTPKGQGKKGQVSLPCISNHGGR